MSANETETDDDEAMIIALSDYLDGALPPAQKQEVDAKLASDAAWKAAHDDMVETRKAISGLQKVRAPATFERDVTSTIHKRSAGRFFGRRTLGDRVPFGVLLVIALVGVGIIAYVLWTSQTGSLKVQPDHEPQPQGSGVIDTP